MNIDLYEIIYKFLLELTQAKKIFLTKLEYL